MKKKQLQTKQLKRIAEDPIFWALWDGKKKMYAIYSERQGEYFLYTPDIKIAARMVSLLNAIEGTP